MDSYPATPPLDPPTLLLVDDDDTFATVLGRSLERRGYRVRTATDHDGAVAIARESPPDYAIVDLKLARSSGLKFVKELRAMSPDTRIVILTGYGSIATAIDAIKSGASHYLTKPADADEVVAAFQRRDGNPDLPLAERPMSVDRMEWEHIQRVLTGVDGNVSSAARVLQMHRRTLQRKLNKYPPRQ